jgi:hypothetical protein
MEVVKNTNQDSKNEFDKQNGVDLNNHLLDHVFVGVQEKSRQIE